MARDGGNVAGNDKMTSATFSLVFVVKTLVMSSSMQYLRSCVLSSGSPSWLSFCNVTCQC